MTSPATVRSALRTATEEVHERLHHVRPFADIAAGRLGRAGYAALLGCLHRFHITLEAGCGDAWGAAARSGDRIARLEADLDHLGAAPPPGPAPWCPPDAPGAALGCLYVAQGSTLGGRVIARQLDYLLPDSRGRSFFAGGPEDGARWRALCALIEREGGIPAQRAAMIAGAEAAFALFERCLERETVHG